jgi:hypothetical protein
VRPRKKIAPRGVGISLSGTPLLAEASLRGARLSGTSLSGILMLANASLYGVWRLVGPFIRGFVTARRPFPLKKKKRTTPTRHPPDASAA